MTRVAIIGNAGGEKSTLARKLSRALKIELFVIDRIQWKPGWVAASAEEINRPDLDLLSQTNSDRQRKQVFHLQSPQEWQQFVRRYCSS